MTPFGRFCARFCLTTGAALLTASAPFSVLGGETVLSYQLDVSRGKVPTMPTVKRIVDIIASLGYDQFQLYTEHAFAYEGHETVWINKFKLKKKLNIQKIKILASGPINS